MQVPVQSTFTNATALETGNTTEASVLVFADTTVPAISLSAMPQSGLAPFETTIMITGPAPLQTSGVSVDGPAQTEVTQIYTSTYTLGMDTPGLYTVRVSATDSDNRSYSADTTVQVLDREQLDTLLQGKWSAMKARLAVGDVDGAVGYFSQGTKPMFEYNFNLLHEHLPEVVAGFRNITLVKTVDGVAEYNLEAIQGAEQFSFYLVFEMGADGIWRIKFF